MLRRFHTSTISKLPSSSPSASVLSHRCRTYTTYRSSDFTFADGGGGFTSTVETKELVVGPLAGGVKITPRTLKQHLDKYVVGQDRAKRVLSTAIFHHYQRVHLTRVRELERQEKILKESQAFAQSVFDDEQAGRAVQMPIVPIWKKDEGELDDDQPLVIEKSNVLCLGPTGVGKTLMVRTLAKILDVPFSMSDCTPFTMAGYVGEDVDQAVHRLLVAANHDVRRAESGIICLDEFDKIAKPKSMIGGGKDISGEGVQQALLKIIEGTTLQINTKADRRPPVGLPGSPIPSPTGMGGGVLGGAKGEVVNVDTSGILFIFTGAFIGLDKIVSTRVAKSSMGFNAHVRESESNQSSLLSQTEPGDLITFGLIPEIVGRIPVTTAVEALTEEALVRVLTEPRNALLRQYQELFNMTGIELRFTSLALREISKAALAMGTGARGLRTVVERLLSDAMFETPGTSIKHVLVNGEVASKKQPPLYFARGQRHTMDALIATEEEKWVASGNKSMLGVQVEEPTQDGAAAAGTGSA